VAIDATGWRVVVTGGANGIGRRTVERIVEADGRVVAVDADEVALARLAADVPLVATTVLDVRDAEMRLRGS
jgi:short-subunit dehydrogenase involved in D-alanine esterification of teichoic acids